MVFKNFLNNWVICVVHEWVSKQPLSTVPFTCIFPVVVDYCSCVANVVLKPCEEGKSSMRAGTKSGWSATVVPIPSMGLTQNRRSIILIKWPDKWKKGKNFVKTIALWGQGMGFHRVEKWVSVSIKTDLRSNPSDPEHVLNQWSEPQRRAESAHSFLLEENIRWEIRPVVWT